VVFSKALEKGGCTDNNESEKGELRDADIQVDKGYLEKLSDGNGDADSSNADISDAYYNENEKLNLKRLKLECDSFGKKMKDKFNFKRHVKTHLDVEPMLKCHNCGKKMKDAFKLKRHLETHVDGETMHECQMYSKTMKHAVGFKRHLVRHKEPMHECCICGKAFKCASSVKRHLKTHLSKEPSRLDLLSVTKSTSFSFDSEHVQFVITENTNQSGHNHMEVSESSSHSGQVQLAATGSSSQSVHVQLAMTESTGRSEHDPLAVTGNTKSYLAEKITTSVDHEKAKSACPIDNIPATLGSNENNEVTGGSGISEAFSVCSKILPIENKSEFRATKVVYGRGKSVNVESCVENLSKGTMHTKKRFWQNKECESPSKVSSGRENGDDCSMSMLTSGMQRSAEVSSYLIYTYIHSLL